MHWPRERASVLASRTLDHPNRQHKDFACLSARPAGRVEFEHAMPAVVSC